MCAGTDNKSVRISYEFRGEILSRCINHLIGYSLNRFFYKWYFIVDNNFHIQFIFCTHKGNK